MAAPIELGETVVEPAAGEPAVESAAAAAEGSQQQLQQESKAWWDRFQPAHACNS